MSRYEDDRGFVTENSMKDMNEWFAHFGEQS